MMQITGVNLLALRLMTVVFSLVFLTGGFVVVLLSGPYHSQIMETHIEELFYLAEHNQESHSSKDHAQKAPEGFGFAPVVDGQVKGWAGNPELVARARAMEPDQWDNGWLVQISMATRAMLGLGENFSYFRIHAADLSHDYLHDRESHIEEIVAIFPAKLMTESMNYYFMGSLGILIFTALFVSLPFVLVVKRQVILPLNRLIGDMRGVSANLLTPREKKSLADDGSIIAEARLALSKLQHEVEREMIQREKLAAVGREIGKINHDMRNALSSFMLLSDNLTNSKDEQVREIAPLMIASIERAVMFCNRTMEFVKPQGSFEPSMVTMDSVMEEVSGSSGIAVEYNGPSKMCLDEHQFYRLLKNLVVNAADAGADRISVNSWQTGKHVVLDITDNGPGISAKIRQKLFTPFHSGTSGGAGLGLSIAREIALNHGGDLRLNSTGLEGSVFRLLLPATVLEDQSS